MSTKLVKPPGMEFRPVGSGYVFGDGTVMRAQPDGCFYLPDSQAHHLERLKCQGWRVWQPEAPKPVYRDQFEREANEHPLDLGKLLDLCRAEEVRLRVFGGDLEIRPMRGDVSFQLLAHLEHQRANLWNYLERQSKIPWRKV